MLNIVCSLESYSWLMMNKAELKLTLLWKIKHFYWNWRFLTGKCCNSGSFFVSSSFSANFINWHRCLIYFNHLTSCQNNWNYKQRRNLPLQKNPRLKNFRKTSTLPNCHMKRLVLPFIYSILGVVTCIANYLLNLLYDSKRPPLFISSMTIDNKSRMIFQMQKTGSKLVQ